VQPLDHGAASLTRPAFAKAEPAASEEWLARRPLPPGEVNKARGERLAYLRRSPRIDRKKLERIVWKPSAVRVTPGITQRIVFS
jgi:hypothetical protein